MTCGTGCRSSEKIWSMKAVLQSHGETLRLRIETLPVLLMSYQWSCEHKWNRVRVSMVSTRTFRRTQIAISARRQKLTGASCRRRTGTVVPRAENFGDFITADHRVLSESESRNNHRYAVMVRQCSGYNHTRANQKLPWRPRRAQ